MRRLAILRRLLRRFDAAIWLAVFCACLFILPVAHAQSTTVIDGSQTNLVIVGTNNSSSGWIAWRSKFIPEHVVFSFELPANFTAVNPIVECSLDDQSQGFNPNDTSKWFRVSLSLPVNPASNPAFDAASVSVGTVAQPASVVIVETGVYPCTAWAIQSAGNNNTFSGSGGSKITAVQLPSSGDAAFLLSNPATGLYTSGANRTAGSQLPNNAPLVTGPVQSFVSCCGAGNSLGDFAVADTSGVKNNATGSVSGLVVQPAMIGTLTHQMIRLRMCENAASITALGAATTQVIPAEGVGLETRVCAVVLSNTNATATTVSIVTGTGVNCASVTSTLLAPITLSANTGSSPNFTLYLGSDSPLTHPTVGNEAVCAVGSAAGSVNVNLIFEAD